MRRDYQNEKSPQTKSPEISSSHAQRKYFYLQEFGNQ